MNVTIVGYGRMGQEVETILHKRGHKVVSRIDRKPGVADAVEVSIEGLKGSDAVIEFSLPEGSIERVELYSKAKVAAVVGTTGWDAEKPRARAIVERDGTSLVCGSNFSVGALLFFQIAEIAAGLIKDLPEYDVMVTEWHHKLKKDSPSGTALTIADHILRALPRKTVVQTEKLDREILDHELHVASVRGGSIPGIHEVLLDSSADSIELKHTARTRTGFALGSVLAAEWIYNQGSPRIGYFTVEQFAHDFFAKALGR